jgi:hypothetical protein
VRSNQGAVNERKLKAMLMAKGIKNGGGQAGGGGRQALSLSPSLSVNTKPAPHGLGEKISPRVHLEEEMRNKKEMKKC